VTIWYFVWLFGIFSPFWYVVPIKIWQPLTKVGADLFSQLEENTLGWCSKKRRSSQEYVCCFLEGPSVLPDGTFSKNPNLGKFCKVLQLKMLVFVMGILSSYFTAEWYLLWLFGTFCGHLVCFTEKNLAALASLFRFQALFYIMSMLRTIWF
jgi:hypothetical protein